MSRLLTRTLPALVVLAILALALFAPARVVRAGKSQPAEVDYLYYPACTNVVQGGVGASTPWTIVAGEGVTQPLGSPDNFASTLLPQGANGHGSDYQYRVVYWDPVNLTPTAGQLQVRSMSFSATYYPILYERTDLFPPVITRAIPNVAEAPPSQVALEVRMTQTFIDGTRTVNLVGDDATATPAALQIHTDGTRTALPGEHPVVQYTLCRGDVVLQDLRVVQSVMKPDVVLDANTTEYIQKFRIPADAMVRWIELAFDQQGPSGELSWGRLQVFDAADQATPPYAFGTPIIDTQISVAVWSPAHWDTHIDLANFPTLTANHDYWLVVSPVNDYWLYAKTLTGSEGWTFASAIGGLWRRDIPYEPATSLPARALDFRIIGTPTGTVGVAPLPPRSPLALHATPNPARGAVAIVWAGAVGELKLEAFDERGRRVASTGQRGDNGRWSFDAGAALPAGVYFVRARDGAGHTANARVTLVR